MIHPIILSGGAGTRMWPCSRQGYPKQYLALNSTQHSLLQETALRAVGGDFAAMLAVTNEDQRFLLAQSLLEVGCGPAKVLLEPVGRNTAPALAAVALYLLADRSDALLLAMPADHVIDDAEAFRAIAKDAADLAQQGFLVTFGVEPRTAHTGYGYIEAGQPLGDDLGGYRVTRFTEKPDARTAQGFLGSGRHYWNSGMFLVSARAYLDELARLAPEIARACKSAVAGGRHDGPFFRLDPVAFAACPADSVDYALMEHTDRAVMVPLDAGWNDVGSWASLWDIGARDGSGNVSRGDVLMKDVRGSYLHSEGPLVAALGLEEMVLVATEDAVLAAPRARAQEVKGLVEDLRRAGRAEYATHRTVHRPWGTFRALSLGDRYQVKEIMVKPGAALSLQMHYHRAEHWVVVQGTAEVTRGEETFLVSENQSVYIPIGIRHRLANDGRVPLRIVEVQSGAYLGEDDIVRFEDVYGRETANAGMPVTEEDPSAGD